MQGSYCFSVKLLAFSSVLCGNSSSFISVFVVKSQTATLCFFSLPGIDLQRKMKEVEKPQRDVGKEERGLYSSEEKKNTCSSHHQLGFLSKLQNQLCQHEGSSWPIPLLPNCALVYSSPETKPSLRKTPPWFTLFKYI